MVGRRVKESLHFIPKSYKKKGDVRELYPKRQNDLFHTEKKNLPSLLLTWPVSSVSCDSEAATREELAIHAIMNNSVVKYFMI